VRLCASPEDTAKEIRSNQVKFTITPYVTLACACIPKTGSIEEFLFHPEIMAELKAVLQVIIEHQEEMQANVITRAQRLREGVEVNDREEENEVEGNSEKEDDRDEQSDDESSITSGKKTDKRVVHMKAITYWNQKIYSYEDVKEKGSTVTSLQLFEEVEEDEEQVMQRADAIKFEEEQRSD